MADADANVPVDAAAAANAPAANAAAVVLPPPVLQPVVPVPEVEQCLRWIGFTNNNATLIAGEMGDTLTDVADLNSKDIRSMAEAFLSRKVADGRVVFKLNQTKKVQAMACWCRDCIKVGDVPSVGGHDRGSFLAAINVSLTRATMRENEKENAESRAKEAMPGALKDGTDFLDWEAQLTSTLYLRYGAKDIPLVYVIREDDAPAAAGNFTNFNEECIARTTLSGPKFEQDDQAVHFLVQGLVAKQSAETFIKPHRKKMSGRADMAALRAHYKGHGNKAKLKAEADGLRSTLHYKTEKALSFDAYLQRVEKMIQLYAQAGLPMAPEAQIDFLLDNIQCPTLASTVATVKSHLTVNPASFTLTSAYNHISGEVKRVNVPVKRGISGALTNVGNQGPGNGNAQGKSNGTDMMPPKEWYALSAKERAEITNKRRNKGGGRGNGGRNNNRNDKRFDKMERQIKSLKKLITDKRKISSTTAGGGDDLSDLDDSESSAAGNQFGGRARAVRFAQDSKKKKKKKNT
jgi:hypothetical protein